MFYSTVSDYAMPGMNGLELLGLALEKAPDAARTAHIDRVTQTSIYSLADLAESRALDIGGHFRRMQEMARILAENLISRSDVPEHLTPDYIDNLNISTLLHDVGKVGIPDGILFKPGKLFPEEFSVMKTHAEIGRETIRKAQARIGIKAFSRSGWR